MKINSINSTQNFGRAIKVFTQNKSISPKTDRAVLEINKVLNSKQTKEYNKSQSEKIREFFKSALGDYNGKDGIIFRKSRDGNLILLSGKDAKAIKEIEENRPELSNNLKNKIVAEEIAKRTETTDNGKQECSFEFSSNHKNKKSPYNIFMYGEMIVKYKNETDGTLEQIRNYDKQEKNKL